VSPSGRPTGECRSSARPRTPHDSASFLAQRSAAAALAGLLLLLAACTTPPGAPSPRAEPPPSGQVQRSTDLPTPPQRRLAAIELFEQNHRTAAEIAAAKGRWNEALWAWDVVLALKPDDADAQAGRRKAEASAQAAVVDRLPRAAQARSRGDLEQATRLYLEVLALRPGHAEAADALRTIERDRSRRQAVGPFARAMVPGSASAAKNAPARSARAAGTRVDLEHASLLAGQGEIDAAIALLQPAPGAQRLDAAARALLADLYVKQADKLVASDKAAAIRALRQGLRTVPGHAAASSRLRQLLAADTAGSASGKSTSTAKPTALSRPSAGPSSGR
jgi:tetratricopeptide (TPR) repeat protein